MTRPQAAAVLGEIARQPWRRSALCAQTDAELWFPEKGGSTREAKRVCAACEVRAECLEDALARHERFGIWGGLSERERRQLLGPPVVAPACGTRAGYQHHRDTGEPACQEFRDANSRHNRDTYTRTTRYQTRRAAS